MLSKQSSQEGATQSQGGANAPPPERNPAYTCTRSDHAQIQDYNDSNQ